MASHHITYLRSCIRRKPRGVRKGDTGGLFQKEEMNKNEGGGGSANLEELEDLNCTITIHISAGEQVHLGLKVVAWAHILQQTNQTR